MRNKPKRDPAEARRSHLAQQARRNALSLMRQTGQAVSIKLPAECGGFRVTLIMAASVLDHGYFLLSYKGRLHVGHNYKDSMIMLDYGPHAFLTIGNAKILAQITSGLPGQA